MTRTVSVLAVGALVAGGILTGSLAFAEPSDTPFIDRREANQQRRIDEGIATGQLTRFEAFRLNERLERIEANEARFKADGVVTPLERAELRRELNQNSRAIFREKHDRQGRRR